MQTPSKTHQFARRGTDWILKQEQSMAPMEIYIHMDRERALTHAIARIQETGGILDLQDEAGKCVDRLEIPKPATKRKSVVLAA